MLEMKLSLHCCVALACASSLSRVQQEWNLSSNIGLLDVDTSTITPPSVQKHVSAGVCGILVTIRCTW